MGKQHKIFPPLEERRTVVKRRIFRLFINLFVLLGAGVLYYVVFSFFFDTPQEYSMRKSTEAMRREYEALSKRLEEWRPYSTMWRSGTGTSSASYSNRNLTFSTNTPLHAGTGWSDCSR